jgi:hypothetical protein
LILAEGGFKYAKKKVAKYLIFSSSAAKACLGFGEILPFSASLN